MLTYAICSSIFFCAVIARLTYLLIQNNRKYSYNLKMQEKQIQNRIQNMQKRHQDQIDILNSKNHQTEKMLQTQKIRSEELHKKIQNTKCLFCEEPSNAKHFCYNCYAKFKNQSIDIRIINCSTINILDYYGNKSFVCDDGRMVRSRAEALISNFFFNNNIRYIYEKPFYFIENGITKTLHPDFFLPDYNLFIEYNELNSAEYFSKKEYAMKIYKKENAKVIVMTEKELYDITGFLIPKLKLIKQS